MQRHTLEWIISSAILDKNYPVGVNAYFDASYDFCSQLFENQVMQKFLSELRKAVLILRTANSK